MVSKTIPLFSLADQTFRDHQAQLNCPADEVTILKWARGKLDLPATGRLGAINALRHKEGLPPFVLVSKRKERPSEGELQAMGRLAREPD